jgi:hypothetical protein
MSIAFHLIYRTSQKQKESNLLFWEMLLNFYIYQAKLLVHQVHSIGQTFFAKQNPKET